MSPLHSRAAPRRVAPRLACAVALAALALTGCATTGSSQQAAAGQRASDPSAPLDPAYKVGSKAAAAAASPKQIASQDAQLTGYIREAAELAMAEGEAYGAVVHLSNLYERAPHDKDVAYDLARHLRYLGAMSEAERVISDALSAHPNDPLLRLESAKILVADGRPGEAVPLLKALNADRPKDPSILSALGVALDRSGAHAEAQAAYDAAIAAGRPNAALLNNAGLSHLMSGDAETAASLLRRATRANGATPQVRQNLAMALSLLGERDEAQRVAETAAPPEMAEAALAAFDSLAPTSTAWDIAAEQ